MKNLSQRKVVQLIFALSLILFFTACKDKDEPTPEYVGKWLTEKTIAVSSGFTNVNYTLEITANHFIETFFQDVYQYKNPGSGTFVSIEGSISVSGNSIKFTPSKISLSIVDLRTSILSKPHKVYLIGDSDFQSFFNSLDFPSSRYPAEFSINNDTLILKADKNSDGAYTGFDEVNTYIKKSILEVIVPAF